VSAKIFRPCGVQIGISAKQTTQIPSTQNFYQLHNTSSLSHLAQICLLHQTNQTMRIQIVCTALLLHALNLCSQGIGIGTQQVVPSAALQIQTTTQGVLFPRMTSDQRKAIGNPETGLMVYDLDKHTIYVFDGQQWMPMLYATADHLLPPTSVAASDGEDGDLFGYSVAIDGDYAIVGAPEDGVGNQGVQGSAYVFKKTNGAWQQQAHLFASNGDVEDLFGTSVSIDGDYAVVGAPYKSVNGASSRGAVYVFVRNGDIWTEQAILLSSDGSMSDHFGHKVAIEGEYLIASAPYNDVGGQNDRGTVYVFKRTGQSWAQTWAINPVSGLSNDHIGKSIAIDSNVVVIGAPGDYNNNMNRCGAVYIYTRTGNLWSQTQLITTTTPQSNLEFGTSVALHNTALLIGAPGYDHSGEANAGAVFIYGYGNGVWGYYIGIVAPEYVDGGNFGFSMALNDTHVLIGAPGHDIDYLNSVGRVWIYQWTPTGPELISHMDYDNGQDGDKFGFALGLHGANAIIGAPHRGENKGVVLFKHVD
jgi:hypothetical protein